MAHIQAMTEVVVKVQAGATISDDIKVKIFAEIALLVKVGRDLLSLTDIKTHCSSACRQDLRCASCQARCFRRCCALHPTRCRSQDPLAYR
jgi:hypothetical protein